jgi:hypothetical protein
MKISVEYYVSLYHQKIEKFFGRTYHSKPHILIDDRARSGIMENTQLDCVYLSSNNLHDKIKAIIEAVLLIEYQNGEIAHVSLGFIPYDIYSGQPSTLELISGSPRILLSSVGSKQQKLISTGCILSVDFKELPKIKSINDLIPINCFCGSSDILPGIQGGLVPVLTNTIDPIAAFRPLGRGTLFIHDLKVHTTPGLDKKFEGFLHQYVRNKYGNVTGKIGIQDRRIIIQAHNSWKGVNDESYVSISSFNAQGVSSSGGALRINDYLLSPQVALFCRIEYRVQIPSNDKKSNDSVFFTLGWCAYLPVYN